MRSLPNILPSVKFQTLEILPVFPVFPVFLGKKRGKFGKKMLDKNGPNQLCGQFQLIDSILNQLSGQFQSIKISEINCPDNANW